MINAAAITPNAPIIATISGIIQLKSGGGVLGGVGVGVGVVIGEVGVVDAGVVVVDGRVGVGVGVGIVVVDGRVGVGVGVGIVVGDVGVVGVGTRTSLDFPPSPTEFSALTL